MLCKQFDKRYSVMGIKISPYRVNEFFDLLNTTLKEPKSEPLFFVTVNPEIAVETISDLEFKEILSSSSINTSDGIGISWAVKYLHGQKVERITGSDSLEKICEIAAQTNNSIYFYGAMPGIAKRAADILEERINELNIIGTYSPSKRDTPFDELPEDVRTGLQEANVVFVALGAPYQEKWINNNISELKNCKVIAGIGGSFDFIAGNIKRAPVFYRKTGLEWLYRLYLQPSRWRRMLKLPLFMINIILLKMARVNN